MNNYQFVMLDGRTCCDVDNPEYMCDACKAALAGDATSSRRRVGAPRAAASAPKKGQVADVTPTPDPYKKDLAALKTASATEPSFEDTWKADRLAALGAEHRRLDAHTEARRTETLRAAEGRKNYPAPNPFEADVKRLRERDARALAAKENR